MRLCFLINPTEDWQPAVRRCHDLCQTALKQNHDVRGVFFYGQAAVIAADSKQQLLWQSMAIENLFICRTMIEQFAISTDLKDNNFKVIGMAQWILLLEQADRIVEVV